MRFYEAAAKGDVVNTLRGAAAHGSLWAIGSAWATGIRQIVIRIFPSQDVGAELLALTITTALGVSVTLLVLRGCRFCDPPADPPPASLSEVAARKRAGRV